MKHLSLFLALMLAITIVHSENINSQKKEQEPTLSPIGIANELLVKNTINQVIKKGLNKSPVDLQPERYHILNEAEHPTDYQKTKSDVEYYPLSKPEGEVSNVTPKHRELRKTPTFYSKDKRPYYGAYKSFRPVDQIEVDGQMNVPVVYMDLDDFKATEDQLTKLQKRLEKAKVFIPQPNLDYYDNAERGVYRPNEQPYYNPMIQEVKDGEEYLKFAIDRVKIMLNKDENINPKVPPIFERVEPKVIGYQSPSNAEKEDLNDHIVKNYHYIAKKEEILKKKADDDKKQDDDLQKQKDIKINPNDVQDKTQTQKPDNTSKRNVSEKILNKKVEKINLK